MDKDDQNPTDEQWQPSSAESWEEVAAEPRPALSQPEQLREPWMNYQQAPETSPADRQRRRRLLGRGIAGGVIFVALVASVVLLRPHREEMS